MLYIKKSTQNKKGRERRPWNIFGILYWIKSVKNIQLGEQWNDSWTIHSKNKVFVGVIIMNQIITCSNQLDNFYKIIQEAKLYLCKIRNEDICVIFMRGVFMGKSWIVLLFLLGYKYERIKINLETGPL